MDTNQPSTSSNYTNPAVDPSDLDIFFVEDQEGCESSRASRRQRRFLTSEEIAAIIANLAPTIATQKAVREAEKAAREAEEAAREAKEAARQKILVTINPGAVWLNRLLTEPQLPPNNQMFGNQQLFVQQPGMWPAANYNFPVNFQYQGFNFQAGQHQGWQVPGAVPNYGNYLHNLPNQGVFPWTSSDLQGFPIVSNSTASVPGPDTLNVPGTSAWESGASSSSSGRLTHSDTQNGTPASRPTSYFNTVHREFDAPAPVPSAQTPSCSSSRVPKRSLAPNDDSKKKKKIRITENPQIPTAQSSSSTNTREDPATTTSSQENATIAVLKSSEAPAASTSTSESSSTSQMNGPAPTLPVQPSTSLSEVVPEPTPHASAVRARAFFPAAERTQEAHVARPTGFSGSGIRSAPAIISRTPSSMSMPTELFDRRHETSVMGTPKPKTPIVSLSWKLPETRIIKKQTAPDQRPQGGRIGESSSPKILRAGQELERKKKKKKGEKKRDESSGKPGKRGKKRAVGRVPTFEAAGEAHDLLRRRLDSIARPSSSSHSRKFSH